MNAAKASEPTDRAATKRYRRPLVLGIAGSVLAELVIFVVYGLLLYPGGDVFTKFLWTVAFCGVGMGSVVGAILALFVVDRLDGPMAVIVTATVTALVLGGACNLLCYHLDTHYFHYFGGGESPLLFIGGGVVMAALGGALGGWLMFTDRGRALLDNVGL